MMNSMDAVIATPDLPGNATVQRVRFVRTVDSQSAVLFPLPAAIGRTAVLLPENNGAPANSSAASPGWRSSTNSRKRAKSCR